MSLGSFSFSAVMLPTASPSHLLASHLSQNASLIADKWFVNSKESLNRSIQVCRLEGVLPTCLRSSLRQSSWVKNGVESYLLGLYCSDTIFTLITLQALASLLGVRIFLATKL